MLGADYTPHGMPKLLAFVLCGFILNETHKIHFVSRHTMYVHCLSLCLCNAALKLHW